MNDDSLSSLIISGHLMYTKVQQSIKSFHMSDLGLIYRNRAFSKIVVVSTTCITDILLIHVSSIATSLLKMISSGVTVTRNLNGGPDKFEHGEQF